MRKIVAAMLVSAVVSSVSTLGCNRTNHVLTTANFRGKFDQIEKRNLEHPGQLTAADLTAALGEGIPTSSADAGVLNLPPGALTSELEWIRWECHNEALFAGMAGGRVSSISRTRR